MGNGVENLPNFPNNLIYILTSIFAIIIFSLLFSKETEWFPKDRVKDIIFFLVCVVFGLVGAAPITASIELIFTVFRSMGNIPIFLEQNALFIYFIFVILLSAIMFIVGMSEDWIDKDGKSMKTFLVLLITMTISLFTALS